MVLIPSVPAMLPMVAMSRLEEMILMITYSPDPMMISMSRIFCSVDFSMAMKITLG
ncbi:hypothetical protein D3C71_2170780 [compost metagenome]